MFMIKFYQIISTKYVKPTVEFCFCEHTMIKLDLVEVVIIEHTIHVEVVILTLRCKQLQFFPEHLLLHSLPASYPAGKGIQIIRNGHSNSSPCLSLFLLLRLPHWIAVRIGVLPDSVPAIDVQHDTGAKSGGQ